jgi:hypothetical protein
MCRNIIFIIAILLIPINSHAIEKIIVNAEGVGNILANSEGRARDIAIDDALRNVIKQAIGDYIDSETIAENTILIKDSIYSHSHDYIHDYTILSETTEGNFYKVSIEATVLSGKLQEDLAAIGLLMERRHKPRIMVIIPEYHMISTRNPDPERRRENRQEVPDPAGETEIIKNLLAAGFKIVDQQQVAKIRYNDQVKAAINGDTKSASQIGLEHGAEIIIIGEAFSESAGRIVSGFESCRARVEARAIKTDTAEILAADGKFANGMDIAQFVAGKKALHNAGKELSVSLIESILANWGNDASNSTSIELIITGLNYREFIKFKTLLNDSLKGISFVHQRTFTNGRATVELDFKGDAQNLSEELVLHDFEGFKVEVTDFSINRLTIKVTSL